MGQVTVVDYIQNNYINYHYEKYIIDLELTLNNFIDDVGKIHISYGEKETDDELQLSQIANSILQFRPDLFDMVVTEYYPRLAEQYAKSDKKGVVTQPVEEPVTNSLQRGFKDKNDLKAMAYVEATKTRLIEEGLLI
jgi:hypothetical protein